MFLLLFGLIFGSGKVDGTDLQYSQVLVSGILAAGVASVSFVNLAISIANATRGRPATIGWDSNAEDLVLHRENRPSPGHGFP